MPCQDYIIQEVQKVYRQQGVDINDKHIEIIVRQMMRKVRMEDSGSTNLLSGAIVDLHEFRAANRAIAERIAAGGDRSSRPRRLSHAPDGHHQGVAGHGELPVALPPSRRPPRC